MPVENQDNKLIYVVAYPSRDAREKSWKAFGADPEWKKLGAQFPDVATVPKLSIAFLSPLAFSDVR